MRKPCTSTVSSGFDFTHPAPPHAAHDAALAPKDHHKENKLNEQEKQAESDRAEYEWKQRRIEEAKQAYLRRQRQRNFDLKEPA